MDRVTYVSRKLMDRYQDAFRRKFDRMAELNARLYDEVNRLASQLTVLAVRYEAHMEELHFSEPVGGRGVPTAKGGTQAEGQASVALPKADAGDQDE